MAVELVCCPCSRPRGPAKFPCPQRGFCPACVSPTPRDAVISGRGRDRGAWGRQWHASQTRPSQQAASLTWSQGRPVWTRQPVPLVPLVPLDFEAPHLEVQRNSLEGSEVSCVPGCMPGCITGQHPIPAGAPASRLASLVGPLARSGDARDGMINLIRSVCRSQLDCANKKELRLPACRAFPA